MRRVTIVLVSLALFASCKENASGFREIPNIETTSTTVTIDRLEKQLTEQPTPEALAEWLWANPIVADLFWGRADFQNPATGDIDSVTYLEAVWNVLRDSTFATHITQATANTFPDLSFLESSLNEAFLRIEAYDPGFQRPKVQTVVSSFYRDIYVSDTVWVVSLENFLGPQAQYRPVGPGGQPLPAYLMRRYQREYMVPMLLKSYAQRYLGQDPNARRTMLDEMLSYGKLYEFTKSVMPELPDSLIVRYSEQEIAGVEANKQVIWSHFIENELLYNSNFLEYRKYIEEAPAVVAIGSSCPGRIGRYIGWQILIQYRKQHPEIPLMVLMQNTNSEKILSESRYKPQ